MVTIFRLTTQSYVVWANKWVGQKIATICRLTTRKRWRVSHHLLCTLELLRHTNAMSNVRLCSIRLQDVCSPFSWTLSSLGSLRPLLLLHSIIQFPSFNLFVSCSPWVDTQCSSCHPVPWLLPMSHPPLPIFCPPPALSVHCSILPHFPVPSAPNLSI